jgi:voltage-gated potassium channel
VAQVQIPPANLFDQEDEMSVWSRLWMNAERMIGHLGVVISTVLATLANRDESEGALGRHSVMLASLIVLLVALPFGQALSGGPTRFPLLLALVLTSAVFVNRHQRWLFGVASVIGAVSIVGIAYAAYFEIHSIRIVAEMLGLALLGFTTLIMFNSLLQTDHVSQDTIVGGICVFLLVGLCFTMIFILMTDLSPGALAEEGHAIVRSALDSSAHATTLLYFSFVTLTTLGYGDVVPHSDMARMFAVAEALIGQLYLVVFLARLVALYLFRARGLVK